MADRSAQGNETKFMVPPSLVYAFCADFTLVLVNLDRKVDLDTIILADEEDSLMICVGGSNEVAQIFLSYAMNECF